MSAETITADSGAHGDHGRGSDGHGSDGHGAEGHGHGGWKFYTMVGVILTIITAVEVAIFYVPALEGILVPTLLVLSAAKFAIVVMFYMHLKFDHKLFSFMFLAGLFLAIVAVTALMLLAHWVPRMGAWA